MTVRAVEWKKPYTWGTAIEITEDKVINLLLREANNLLQVNGDNELYCDLQLNDELRPTDDFPVGVTTGRIVEDNGWDRTGTILCAKTTSWDNVKLVYTDEGEIWIDNWTGTFKKLYLASEVDDLLSELESELKDYVDNKSTFKPYPAEFVTNLTTAQFLTSIENQDLPVGNVYLWQVSLSDMPVWVNVQAEVEVYIYPQNIVYCIMRSAEVVPYVWQVNSYSNRWWEPIANQYTGSSAPLNPTEWMIWYDTTNDVLKTYDGTQWNEVWWNQWVAWWSITGTLSDQIDLQNALDWKQDVLQAWNWITISSTSQQRWRRSASTLSISIDTDVVATQWEIVWKEDTLTAWANVDIYEAPVYEIITVNDMMGPCQPWFHVPTYNEWDNIDTAWYNLWAWVSSSNSFISKYLKLPLAWYRANDTWTVWNVETRWYYWMCIHGQYNWWASYRIIRPERAFSTSHYDSLWLSIRPFKDTPVAPDSDWTVLYQGSWSAGIFHNPDLWLISISSNWTTWYTIADKNIWATVVWNDWDTLSAENCWWFFQRWNNYMFPRIWSVTTSSSTVDASSYWPWNYYSSSTFIAINGSWSNPENRNLRWWVSQGTSQQRVPTWETVHTIKAVPTVWTTAPADPVTWTMWYDTWNSAFKIYDWTTRQTV